MTGLQFDEFDALTFDCYGTLIDWEAGIVTGLRAALGARLIDVTDDQLLERFAASEAALEAGPYRPYRDILGACLSEVAGLVAATPTEAERVRFGASVADWPAFEDAPAALASGKTRMSAMLIARKAPGASTRRCPAITVSRSATHSSYSVSIS